MVRAGEGNPHTVHKAKNKKELGMFCIEGCLRLTSLNKKPINSCICYSFDLFNSTYINQKLTVYLMVIAESHVHTNTLEGFRGIYFLCYHVYILLKDVHYFNYIVNIYLPCGHQLTSITVSITVYCSSFIFALILK